MTRGKPFEPGNKLGQGRPPGSRNKMGNEGRKLLDENDAALTYKCISAALRGDIRALSLCMDRLVPLRRQPTPKLKLRRLETVDDITRAQGDLINAIAKGDCPPAEGQVLADLLTARLDMIPFKDLEARLLNLEKLFKKAA
jgi:hypothetical protein